jgi:predicted thioesterase
MSNVMLALQGSLKVLAVSLLLGAGLPMIFGLGVRFLAPGVGGDAEVDHVRSKPIGRVLAVLCFLIVLTGVGAGITIVVASGFGKAVSFEHIYPVLVKK